MAGGNPEGVSRKIPPETVGRPHPRALRPRERRPAASLRGSETCGHPAALRLPPRMGRGPEVLGRPARTLPRHLRQAPGHGGRGPPGRVRRFRGGHPGGQLRGRRGHRLGPGALDPDRGSRRRDEEGQAPLRAAGLQAARQVDARADEDQRQDDGQGVAPHQGARRLGPQGRGGRVLPGVHLFGTHPRGARLGREPRRRRARRARAPEGTPPPPPRIHRQADARRAARRAVHEEGMALGAQVRRLSPARRARRRRGAPLPPQGWRRDRDLPRDRAGPAGAALLVARARWRARRARRQGPAELRTPAEAGAPAAPARHRARLRRAAHDPLRLRPARLRGLRPAPAAARDPQGPAAAHPAAPRAPSATPTTSSGRGMHCSRRSPASGWKESSGRSRTLPIGAAAPGTGSRSGSIGPATSRSSATRGPRARARVSEPCIWPAGRQAASSTPVASARDSPKKSCAPSAPGSRAPPARRLRAAAPCRRARVTSGSSPRSSARSDSRNARGTACCATRRSCGSGRTSRSQTASARTARRAKPNRPARRSRRRRRRPSRSPISTRSSGPRRDTPRAT